MTDTSHFSSGKALSFGDILHPAMAITDPADAQVYLAAYEAYLVQRWGETPETAHQCALTNIGYFAGYYSFETRQRMERLFSATHPFIGSPEKPQPSVSELLQIGKDIASKL